MAQRAGVLYNDYHIPHMVVFLEKEKRMYEVFDTVEGKTIATSSNGTFIGLDDGVTGWIKKLYIPAGRDVVCTVVGVRDNGFLILALDSVRYPSAA